MNSSPEDGDENVGLLRPICFSVRDAETYVDLSLLEVRVGYASVHSNGQELFDLLPDTRRVSLFPGAVTDGLIDVIDDGVLIVKTSSNPQKTVYATRIDTGLGYQSLMLSAVLRRDVEDDAGPLNASIYPGLTMPVGFSPGGGGAETSEEDEPFTGTVMGIEHGPRGVAAYLWFQRETDGTRFVRLTSYIRNDNNPTVNEIADFDWSALHRFTILWNEAEGYVEVFATSTTTQRLFRVAISSFPTMPSDYYRHSRVGEIVAFYGQEGGLGGRSLWSNIAVTSDVGYPVRGSIKMSNFITQVRGPEFWKVSGAEDPRLVEVGPWFIAPTSLFADLDPSASARVSGNQFRMTKVTLGDTFALYRRELGFGSAEGFMVQARIEGVGLTKEETCTGMGFTVYDGTSVFQVVLFVDDTGVERVGLLRTGGDAADINDYYTADFTWSEKAFRFVVDPREEFIRLFDAEDLETPVLDISLDRDTLPDAAEKGWVGEIPFIAMGHTVPTQTTGIFVLHNLVFSHLYQGWSAADHAPTAADPPLTFASTGSPTVVTDNGVTTIVCDPNELASYSRTVAMSSLRGATAEFRARVTSFRPRHRTGVYALLDDGVRTFALTFVDSYSGKYVALALRDGTGSFREVVGRDGEGAQYSFPLDWTEFHTYRIERQLYRGVSVYVDDETSPRLVFPESNLALLPTPQYSGTPKLAFGQFTGEGATSEWAFFNGFFSRGYEVSTKKNKSDTVLLDELFGTQAIVLVTVTDA